MAPSYEVDCPAAFVYNASWADEHVIRGTPALPQCAAAATFAI